MKIIDFSKLNGQGNDFILIDSTKEKIIFSPEQVKHICDRHYGVGGDGVIFVRGSSIADLFMDYYNSDGSLAEMCGNGIRCMARFAHDKGILKNEAMAIETRAGIKNVSLKLEDGEVKLIEVSMGAPILKTESIPINTELIEKYVIEDIKDDNIEISSIKAENINKCPKKVLNKFNSKANFNNKVNYVNYNIFFNKKVKIFNEYFNFNCVSMGNPHCVIFLDEAESLEDINLLTFGPEIENHPLFPNKTNVEFVKINNDNEISMRVWERGCGETLACGTGACASVVAAIISGRIKSSSVKVHLKGGELIISWDGNLNNSVYLSGSVDYAFDGRYFLRD